MNQNLKSILKAIGYAIITILLVNLIYFLIEFSKVDTSESWNFVFKHGVFSLNEKLTGLRLWSPKANGIMLIIFMATLITEYKKGNFKPI